MKQQRGMPSTHPEEHGCVELWLFSRDLPNENEHSQLAAYLSTEERKRSARFLDPQDRHRYIVSRGRLREILSGYTSMPPQLIQFRYGKHGKPYLDGYPPIFFNLSHSGHLAAVAISKQFNIGVDIERVRIVRRNLPERYFSAHEIAGLAELQGEAWQSAFFRCWTRKEAFIKALGEGMRQPLKSFSVTFQDNQPARLTWMSGDAEAPNNWTFIDLLPAPGFAGAIALKTNGAAVPRLRIMGARAA